MLLLNSSLLLKLVEEINKDLNSKIPELNAGGCGVFASIMYKKLKTLGYSPKIGILDNDEYNFKIKKDTLNKVTNKERVKKSDKKNTSFAHCYIEVDGVIFDGLKKGHSVISYFYSYPKVGIYTIEELDLSLKVAGWNSSFKRRKKSPTLRASINRAVKKIYSTKVV